MKTVHNLLFIAGLCLLPLTATAQEACDLKAVDIVSLGDGATAQLETQLFHEAPTDIGYPSATRVLVLEDGRRIDLGTGSKFIDDGESSCENILAEAHGTVLDSLSAPGRVSNLSPKLLQVWHENEGCTEDQSACNDLVSDGVEVWAAQPDRLVYGIAWPSPVQVNNLTANDAIIISVRMSAYYAREIALDLKKGRAIDLWTEGC